MAASGINEHYEACRKQSVMNRQAYLKQMLLKKFGGYTCDEHLQFHGENVKPRNVSQQQNHLHSYHAEKLSNEHSMMGTDQQSCKMKNQSRNLMYSAKINGRFTSTNYCQQW